VLTVERSEYRGSYPSYSRTDLSRLQSPSIVGSSLLVMAEDLTLPRCETNNCTNADSNSGTRSMIVPRDQLKAHLIPRSHSCTSCICHRTRRSQN